MENLVLAGVDGKEVLFFGLGIPVVLLILFAISEWRKGLLSEGEEDALFLGFGAVGIFVALLIASSVLYGVGAIVRAIFF